MLFVCVDIYMRARCVTSLSDASAKLFFYTKNNIICFVPPSLYNHVCYLDFSNKFRNKGPISAFLTCFFLAMIW